MWRLFRSPKSLLPSARVASSIPPGQTVHVQRVKLAKPARFRLRNFIIGGAVFYGCYTAYTTVVLSPMFRWLEDEVQNLPPEERKALEEEEEQRPAAFIAFPFTTHAVKPPPYSRRDPEWLEFVKLSKDKSLLKKIRNDLAHMVRRGAEASVVLTRKTGKGLKVRRYWLDIDYPYGPPIEYRRSGLRWTEEGLEWASQPVESSVVNTINRVLWPYPLILSTWAFAGVMFKQNVQDLLRALGYEPRSSSVYSPSTTPQGPPTTSATSSPLPSQHHPDIQRALQRLQQQTTKRPEEVKDPRAMASPNNGGASYGAAPAAAAPPVGPSQPPGSSTDKSKANQQRPGDLLPGQTSSPSISEPWKAFVQQFTKALKRVPETPPRGSIIVSGLVELEAPMSYVVLDVFAFWNPQTKQYDDKSMIVRLRRVQMKNQAPLRK